MTQPSEDSPIGDDHRDQIGSQDHATQRSSASSRGDDDVSQPNQTVVFPISEAAVPQADGEP